MDNVKGNLFERPAITVDLDTPFRVTDLKQWVYCPRVLYYSLCLPDVRPWTYKMEAGVEAGQEEEIREARRSLRAYGLSAGRKEYNVPVASARLGLRGTVDMVIWVEKGILVEEVIPVDYKLSKIAGEHFKLQLVAYGLLLEEMSGAAARYGFIYSIPLKRSERVLFDERLRAKLTETLEAMQRMLFREEMPDPTLQRGKCVGCEFRRFCNDVL